MSVVYVVEGLVTVLEFVSNVESVLVCVLGVTSVTGVTGVGDFRGD